jgi:CII-binding regulator of phage lambda lysogenization HflD
MAKLEGQLSEKTSLVGRLEAELQQLRRTVDQARTREHKLTRELQQVLY